MSSLTSIELLDRRLHTYTQIFVARVGTMTRFGLDSSASSGGAVVSRRALGDSAIQLSCLSPDGRAVHTVVSYEDSIAIQTSSLPLKGTTEDDTWDSDEPAVVRTRLPDSVAAIIGSDGAPPRELLCVETSGSPEPKTTVGGTVLRLLPLLCLYTQRSAFLLQLGYPENFQKDAAEDTVDGLCVTALQPFESQLASLGLDYAIVRIRAAPNQNWGFATYAPRGAMAMLAHDKATNHYSLFLNHGMSTRTPQMPMLKFGMETCGDEGAETITDFSFCQSQALSLLASVSINLLKGNGDVLAASPIVFDGTMVLRSAYEETIQYLQNAHQDAENSLAKQQQCKVAFVFFDEAFCDIGDPDFLKACVFTGNEQSPTLWPLQEPAPIVMADSNEDGNNNPAVSIEPFACRGLIGVAIGHQQPSVDFAAMSPSAILPRFVYEGEGNKAILNEELKKGLGTIVESIDFDMRGVANKASGMACLIRDPMKEKLIHYQSNQCIISISTSALLNVSRELWQNEEGKGSPEEEESRAWTAMEIHNPEIQFIGAVVSTDVRLGHVLVGSLSNGK